jgi:flagellar basal-body rod protein FlgB
MDFASLPLLTGLEARMRYAQQRQNVISQNIANADTPGYKARRVIEPKFAQVLKSVESSGRENLVISPRINVPDAFRTFGSRAALAQMSEVDSRVSDVKPNGNSVALEDQLSDLSDVQIEYNELINLYRKQIGLFRIALGKGR